MIVDQLRPLAIDISLLAYDPNNTRKRTDKNLDAIKSSLSAFGQRVPIVCQKTDSGIIVRAGNGRLQAARELGWTEIAAVIIEEDNISATGYSIADNRSGELSEWDEDTLKVAIKTLSDEDFDLLNIGFDVKDMEKFDIEMQLDDIDVSMPEIPEQTKAKKLKTCPDCGCEF